MANSSPLPAKSLLEREQYHSSGRVYWLEFLTGTCACVVYVFMASIYLDWSRSNSSYYIFLSFFYTIVPLAILVGGTVYWSHCQSVLLAAALAFPCCFGLWVGQILLDYAPCAAGIAPGRFASLYHK